MEDEKNIVEIINEILNELLDPNGQISYYPDGYKHNILDEEDPDNQG